MVKKNPKKIPGKYYLPEIFDAKVREISELKNLNITDIIEVSVFIFLQLEESKVENAIFDYNRWLMDPNRDSWNFLQISPNKQQ